MAPATEAMPGSAIGAVTLGAIGTLLIPLALVPVLLGMAGLAAAVTARGEIVRNGRRGAGLSLAGFMLSLAATAGGLLGLLG
ncbi:hypothetical protein FB562_0749 [Homoserinimonas aerilata]|uniref:DUF4190 domain-containing protein n=1 Tax=Homoserinimonas aerilata TaxID=1162970 RepID=A0A542YHW0_9MICO|nr:hypothetical protein [Homoserinimonas aerilata]TQL47683.1 hypothetical protein FB562_0749 [Homoserinimonas aerilata]